MEVRDGLEGSGTLGAEQIAYFGLGKPEVHWMDFGGSAVQIGKGCQVVAEQRRRDLVGRQMVLDFDYFVESCNHSFE